MNPIPISSCHNCDEEKWEVERDSVGTYLCKRCRSIVRKILRRKEN